MSSLSYEEIKANAAEIITDDFVDAFSWAGTPDDVADKVANVVDAGYTNICIVPHAPTEGCVQDVVRSFTKDVVPRIRALMT